MAGDSATSAQRLTPAKPMPDEDRSHFVGSLTREEFRTDGAWSSREGGWVSGPGERISAM